MAIFVLERIVSSLKMNVYTSYLLKPSLKLRRSLTNDLLGMCVFLHRGSRAPIQKTWYDPVR